MVSHGSMASVASDKLTICGSITSVTLRTVTATVYKASQSCNLWSWSFRSVTKLWCRYCSSHLVANWVSLVKLGWPTCDSVASDGGLTSLILAHWLFRILWHLFGWQWWFCGIWFVATCDSRGYSLSGGVQPVVLRHLVGLEPLELWHSGVLCYLICSHFSWIVIYAHRVVL